MTPQEIYIPVDSQELADELKSICIKYGLPIWDIGFINLSTTKSYFAFSDQDQEFFLLNEDLGKTQITKEQFIELLENINN